MDNLIRRLVGLAAVLSLLATISMVRAQMTAVSPVIVKTCSLGQVFSSISEAGVFGCIAVAETALANVFTGPQSVTPITVAAGTCTGTYTFTPTGVATTGANLNILNCAAGAAITIANPSVMTPGTPLDFQITGAAGGAPTLSAVGSFYKFPGAALPVLTSGNSKADGISCMVVTATFIWCGGSSADLR